LTGLTAPPALAKILVTRADARSICGS